MTVCSFTTSTRGSCVHLGLVFCTEHAFNPINKNKTERALINFLILCIILCVLRVVLFRALGTCCGNRSRTCYPEVMSLAMISELPVKELVSVSPCHDTFLVAGEGFEPTTSSLWGWRATTATIPLWFFLFDLVKDVKISKVYFRSDQRRIP